jgi:site-specific recombinase XerD
METLDKYLNKKHSDQTAKTYQYNIDVFLMQYPTAKTFLYRDIINYLDTMKKKNPKGSVSIKLTSIKRYYDYLLETGQRNDHPCRKIHLKNKKKPIQIQDLFTTTELQALMNRENKYKNLELRNKVIISLLIHQGLTSAELCKLEVNDIDLDTGTVYIKASKKNSRRTLTLQPSQIMLVQNYINTPRKNLIRKKSNTLILTQTGKAEMVDGIHYVIESLKGLYPDRTLNPLTIRQSVISNMLNEKKIPLEDVQLFAGHKYPSTTEQYKRKDINEQREKINLWHPLR